MEKGKRKFIFMLLRIGERIKWKTNFIQKLLLWVFFHSPSNINIIISNATHENNHYTEPAIQQGGELECKNRIISIGMLKPQDRSPSIADSLHRLRIHLPHFLSHQCGLVIMWAVEWRWFLSLGETIQHTKLIFIVIWYTRIYKFCLLMKIALSCGMASAYRLPIRLLYIFRFSASPSIHNRMNVYTDGISCRVEKCVRTQRKMINFYFISSLVLPLPAPGTIQQCQ